MRPGSANANGIPVGDPHFVPTSGSMSAALTVGYLRTCASTSRPSGQRALPQLLLAKRAGVDLAVPGGLDLLGAEVDRLGQGAQVGVGPAGAELLVDRDVEQPGLLARGELAEQPLVLALLHVAVEVGHPARGTPPRG